MVVTLSFLQWGFISYGKFSVFGQPGGSMVLVSHNEEYIHESRCDLIISTSVEGTFYLMVALNLI